MTESHRGEIAKLETLYSANPGGRIFTHLAEAYRKAGELERARETVEQGLDLHSEYPSAHVVHGRVLVDLGEDDAAARAFERVLDLDPENRVALRALGDLAWTSEETDEALVHYRSLLNLDPGDEEVESLVRLAEEANVVEFEEIAPADPVRVTDLGDATEPPEAGPDDWHPSAGDTLDDGLELDMASIGFDDSAVDVDGLGLESPVDEAGGEEEEWAALDLDAVGHGTDNLGTDSPADLAVPEEIESEPFEAGFVPTSEGMGEETGEDGEGWLELDEIPEDLPISEVSDPEPLHGEELSAEIGGHDVGDAGEIELETFESELSDEDIGDAAEIPMIGEQAFTGEDGSGSDGLDLMESDLVEPAELEFAESDVAEADELELAESDVAPVDELDLAAADIIESDELELAESDVAEADELDLAAADIIESDELELAESDVAEADELDLAAADVVEPDELELAESDVVAADELELAEADVVEAGELELAEADVTGVDEFVLAGADQVADSAVGPHGSVHTETMADLYARQGLYSQAAEVYAELLRQRPEDAHLRSRLQEVRTLAAGGVPAAESVATGPSIGDYLEALAGFSPEPSRVVVDPSAGEEDESLLQSEESVVEGGTASESEELDEFDLLFESNTPDTGGAVDSAVEPAITEESEPSEDDDDLEMFRAWLQNLKR